MTVAKGSDPPRAASVGRPLRVGLALVYASLAVAFAVTLGFSSWFRASLVVLFLANAVFHALLDYRSAWLVTGVGKILVAILIGVAALVGEVSPFWTVGALVFLTTGITFLTVGRGLDEPVSQESRTGEQPREPASSTPSVRPPNSA